MKNLRSRTFFSFFLPKADAWGSGLPDMTELTLNVDMRRLPGAKVKNVPRYGDFGQGDTPPSSRNASWSKAEASAV